MATTFSSRRRRRDLPSLPPPHGTMNLKEEEESDDTSSYSSSSGSPTTNPSPLLLYTLLPSLLQRRIPGRLRSLRQALSSFNTPLPPPPLPSTKTRQPPPSTQTRHIRIPSTESITPPPSYQSNVSSEAGSRPGSSSTSSSSSSTTSSEERSWRRHSRPLSSSSGGREAVSTYLIEEGDRGGGEEKGVNWRYARPGIALLELACQEDASSSASSSSSSSSSSTATPGQDIHYSNKRTNFIRRQYIDGVACILRGLPPTLTIEEEVCLREALPFSISSSSFPSTPGEKRDIYRSRKGEEYLRNSTSTHPTLLHRLTASLTLYIFLLISFLAPYIQQFLQRGWYYNRKYRLTERAFAQSVVLVDTVGRQGIDIARRVCGWNEGFIGELVGDLGGYCVRGVGGGVFEGVGEGLRVCGVGEWGGGIGRGRDGGE